MQQLCAPPRLRRPVTPRFATKAKGVDKMACLGGGDFLRRAGAPLLAAFLALQSAERCTASFDYDGGQADAGPIKPEVFRAAAGSGPALSYGTYAPQTEGGQGAAASLLSAAHSAAASMPLMPPVNLPAVPPMVMPTPVMPPSPMVMPTPIGVPTPMVLPIPSAMPSAGSRLPATGAANHGENFGLLAFSGPVGGNPLSAQAPGLSPQGPGGNLRSRNALAASLPVHAEEGGGVTNAGPVSDTRSPVGFHASADGVYVAPRFPSTLLAIREPSEDMIKKCIMHISASKMTNGFSDTLKSGGVQLSGNAQHQLLRVMATSSPRFTSKLSAPYVLFQRATGTRLSYDVKLGIPHGCVLLPSDPNLMAYIQREGKYIVEAQVRLYPDVLASYMPSVAPVPSDILAFSANLPPNSNFQPAGHCVFVAHFTTQPENIQLSASHTQVRVEVATEAGVEVLDLEIPMLCLPQSLHRTAMWTTPVTNGTAVIVAFSPPPQTDSEWFLIRTTGDEATFRRTSAPGK